MTVGERLERLRIEQGLTQEGERFISFLDVLNMLNENGRK